MCLRRWLTVSFLVLVGLASPLWAVESEKVGTEPGEASLQPQTFGPDYIIGPGDELSIEVWKDEALTRTPIVLPDGKIAFPLIGELKAAGKTVSQLKKEIEEKLARYMENLVLTVEVRQSNSMHVYVLGHVQSPGRMVLNSNINVMQALAMAGGLSEFASPSRIRILRQEGDRNVILPFNYHQVTAGKQLEMNILLKRGDVVIVP